MDQKWPPPPPKNIGEDSFAMVGIADAIHPEHSRARGNIFAANLGTLGETIHHPPTLPMFHNKLHHIYIINII